MKYELPDRIRRAITLLLALGACSSCLVMPGCSGEEEASAAESVPVVDPRYASADALVGHYNELAQKPIPDIRRIFTLLYAENDQQQRMIHFYQEAIPTIELDQVIWEQFGRGLFTPSGDAPLAPDKEPARIVERSPQRARAEYRESDGGKADLYLVQVGERWWISGYTLEYDEELKSLREEIDEAERMIKYMGPVAPDIARRVRAGEFRSPDEVGFALGVAMAQRFPELQTNPDLLSGGG